MKWVRCNHRHALHKDYDYFYQGPSGKSWPWSFPYMASLIRQLRLAYSEEAADHQLFARNPAWHLDRKRNRLWVRSDVFMMIQLRAASGARITT